MGATGDPPAATQTGRNGLGRCPPMDRHPQGTGDPRGPGAIEGPPPARDWRPTRSLPPGRNHQWQELRLRLRHEPPGNRLGTSTEGKLRRVTAPEGKARECRAARSMSPVSAELAAGGAPPACCTCPTRVSGRAGKQDGERAKGDLKHRFEEHATRNPGGCAVRPAGRMKLRRADFVASPDFGPAARRPSGPVWQGKRQAKVGGAASPGGLDLHGSLSGGTRGPRTSSSSPVPPRLWSTRLRQRSSGAQGVEPPVGRQSKRGNSWTQPADRSRGQRYQVRSRVSTRVFEPGGGPIGRAPQGAAS